jgi:cytochrome c
MKTLPSAALAIATLLGACAPALASEQLAQQKQCMQCHAVDRHVAGPSFQAIGAIYRTMENPLPRLVAVIRDGSTAHMGPLWDHARMPDTSERPQVSPAEARQLAQWILSQPAP